MEGVIEKATKKLRTEREKQLAKKAAEERIKRVKNAKMFMFLNFARIATFNTWSMSEFTGCLILSLAPKQYHKHIFDAKLNMSKHLKSAMIAFQDTFGMFLDRDQAEKESPTVITTEKNLHVKLQKICVLGLQSDFKLSRVEYLMLFVAFLSIHKAALVRTNFAIDVSTFRGQIKFGEISKNTVQLPQLSEFKSRKRNLSQMTVIEEETKKTRRGKGQKR